MPHSDKAWHNQQRVCPSGNNIVSVFLNMGKNRLLFVYFRPFLKAMANVGSAKFNYKSVDDVLGIRTRDRRMVSADESTELWGLPENCDSNLSSRCGTDSSMVQKQF